MATDTTQGGGGPPAVPSSIAPIPVERRTLSAFDVGILWNDLSLGLLVLVTGGLLVPALEIGDAYAAIAIGTVLGCAPLAAVALAGAREGLPAMVLFRPVLGRVGSFAPSLLNVAQLVGWTAVEFWAMGRLANSLSIDLLDTDAFALWLALVAAGCTWLAVGGPVLVVKRFLERFGTWIVLASGIGLTAALIAEPTPVEGWDDGTGGLPFWLAVDLVIVMPISWLPLVADSTRFARRARGVFGATYAGYALGNVWFYGLGAVLVLHASASPDAVGMGGAIAGLAGGTALVLGLLVGEAPNAFANVYSAAVSALNVVPRVPATVLAIITGAVAFLLALVVTMERYEVFLFLIGSVFVPLAGIFVADYFVLARGRYGADLVFGRQVEPVRWRALVPWLAGFVLYHWSVPTGPEGWIEGVEGLFTSLGLPFPLLDSRLGASLPSFAVAFALTLAVRPRRIASVEAD
ncbi:MAG TPA: cytosine permease [Actinomycetota bacterium]|nr:cytosine permease [Actinomycetota bacterium]